MTARLCWTTLLCLSFAVSASTTAQAALLLEISPGPAANQTTWTFSGETETLFGFFNIHGEVTEAEPASMWGDFPHFTTLDDTHLTVFSGTANIVKNGTETRAIGNAWVDDGSDNTAPDREATGDAIGVILPGDDEFEVGEGDTLSWSGSLVMDGAGISAFSAGGLPYSGDSTRFYNEGNNIPMTLSIVVPEPSTCLLSLAALGTLAICSHRRSRS